jgi:uncharacterized Zn finger protein
LDKSKPDSDPMGRWASLTWEDLEQWAGSQSVTRGRAYQRAGQVEKLAKSPDGKLLSTVAGGRRYAVAVGLGEPGVKVAHGLASACTCPVGADGCKHAVATVVEYLELLRRGDDVPVADSADPRWRKLGRDDVAPAASDAPRTGSSRAKWDAKIRQHLFAKGQEELAELVFSLTSRFPELRRELKERIALTEGNVDQLVAQARKEMRRVTTRDAWTNHWSGEGDLPDYGRLRGRLERLLELGHADAVVELGREMLHRGMEQVERAHDEGETAAELTDSLGVVFRALASSNLPPFRKLMFAIDATLRDDFGLTDEVAGVVLDAEYAPDVWSAVADKLLGRLKARPTTCAGDAYSVNYERDQLSEWLATAFENAGRGSEVLSLYEREARATGSYERFVAALIDAGRPDDAERWAAEGIEKTARSLRGTASSLAEKLCDLARRRKQWDIVAAHAALAFFRGPSRQTFALLSAAAAKAGCEEPVRRLARSLLETGVSPVRIVLSKSEKPRVDVDPAWPLPVPDSLVPLLTSNAEAARTRASTTRPNYEVLIDIAIADKRGDEVLHWYDGWRARQKANQKNPTPGVWWAGPAAYAERVAEAVAKSHPERALAVYADRLKHQLLDASARAYEEVAACLRKMKPVLEALDRAEEWQRTVEDIRVRYRNRPRLMETLDRLQTRPIASTGKRPRMAT